MPKKNRLTFVVNMDFNAPETRQLVSTELICAQIEATAERAAFVATDGKIPKVTVTTKYARR